MAKHEPRAINRRTVIGAVWATPVIVAATAVPAMAASAPLSQLSLEVSPPSPYENRTSFVIRATNEGAAAIPAGALTAYLPLNGFWFSGFSGDIAWNYGPDDPTGESYTFVYNASVPAGDTAGPLLLILGKNDPDQSPPPVATLTMSASGYSSVSGSLPLL
ncbi:hypothetical protein NVV95_11210 [Herbiconiux sp. CPCC 205716]|uniref:DUF11 domain-containing protein n=1 Tax=Herbiconiux gentiana TaxID=2970912 RepID=A0ABT2GFY3_9MICO|nr:hypothetical protein [Herbiconiux gentiana]MCS5715120.1 hypothetical protein [Herbiconiux gentiana]